jgi:hypothetical protein
MYKNGFTWVWEFTDWVAAFEREIWSSWWIKEDGTILIDWFNYTNSFSNWFWIFTDVDNRDGVINSMWEVIVKWLSRCSSFSKGGTALVWDMIDKKWWIDTKWKYIAKWFDNAWNFCNWRTDFLQNWFKWQLSCNFKNWFAVARMGIGEWNISRDRFIVWYHEWWFKNDWTLLDYWFDKCHPFNEEIKWFAKFEKEWTYWFIDANWNKYTILNKNWDKYLKSVNTGTIFLISVLNKN